MSQPLPPQSSVEAYLAALKQSSFFASKDTHGSLEYLLAYFRRHSTEKKNKFRISNVLLILMSAALPLLAAFGDRLVGVENKDLVLSIVSAAIAVLTGLLAHYRWDVGWRGQTEALFALNGLRAEWDAQVAAARVATDQEETVKRLAEAFERLRSGTFEVVRAEMGEFFKVLKAPDAPPSLLRGPG